MDGRQFFIKVPNVRLGVLFDPSLMLAKQLSRVVYFLAPWNWSINNPKSYVQEVTLLSLICLNHCLVVAVNVTAKHLHRACDET